MSAESEMSSILNHATSSAAGLTGSAQTLVNAARAVIEEPVELPYIPVDIQARGRVNLDKRTFAPSPDDKPGLPKFPVVEIPALPSLVEVEDVDAQFDEVLDRLSFPTFRYSSASQAPSFNTTEPSLDTQITLGTAPDLSLPPTPTLQTLTTLPSVEMDVPPPEFAPIRVDLRFEPNFFAQQRGHFSNSIVGELDPLLEELSAMSNQALGSLFSDFIRRIGQQLTNRYQSGLALAESSIQSGLTAALQEEADRVRTALQDRSGWDLPALVQQAVAATVEQSISAWQAQAQSQQATDQWEQAQEVFEVSATLYEKLRRTIQELKTKELELVVESHRQSIRYAQQVTDALLTAFTVENYKKYDLEFKKAEAQLKQFEAQLKVQLIEHEVVFAKLEAEKAKQDQDGLLVQQYQAEMQRLESENRLLATQVATARTELELQALPVELYEAQLRAFGAKVNAHEAKVSALVAEISGNTAQIEGESAKLKGFEAQVDAFIAEVNAHRAVVQAQKQRNDLVLEELQAKVKAALVPVEVSMSQAKYQLAVYETAAKDFLVDAKAELEKTKLDEEWRQQEQKGMFDAYQMTREQALSIAGKKLQVLKAVAEVNGEGAQVLASMAGGAMSAANGIANVIFREEA